MTQPSNSVLHDEMSKSQFIAAVDEYAIELLTDRHRQASALSEKYGRMWDFLVQTYSAGGKRLRPYMAYVVYRALGGKSYTLRALLPIAVAIEFVHIAMLIHDDIIDGDDIRHGSHNMSGLYKQAYSQAKRGADLEHAAYGAAMLAGDALLSEAYRLAMSSSLSSAHIEQIVATIGQSIFEVIGGELLDTESSHEAIGDVDARLIASLKTASYSFVMPMTIGAIMADANEQTVEEMTAIGSMFGISFQIIDDDLGVFGDEVVTGKSTTNDIIQQKPTMLLQLTLSMASEHDKQRLLELLDITDKTDQDVQHIRDIIERSGARAANLTRSHEYVERAIQKIDHLHLDETVAREMTAFLQTIAGRTA